MTSTINAMTNLEKSASLLPADPLLWGQDIQAEVVNRLPALQAFITSTKVLSHDQNGEGIVLVFLKLTAGEAFIPVVVRDWKMQPVDVVIYKQGKEVKYKYLSERNLTVLANNVGVGKFSPIKPFGSMSASQNVLNLSTPADGLGGRIPGSNMPSKSASTTSFEDYFIPTLDFIRVFTEEGQKMSYWKNTKLASSFTTSTPELQSKFNVLVRDPLTDRHLLYSDRSEQPLTLSTDQVATLFSAAFPEPATRFEKTAGYLESQVKVVGNIMNRDGNIHTQYVNRNLDSTFGKPSLPEGEGMFYIGTNICYINPHVTYLNGEPYSYALVATIGKYALVKEVEFTLKDEGESTNFSKDDLLPQARPEKLLPGQVITIYDGKRRSTSVPCKVLFVSTGVDRFPVVTVTPLFGDIGKVDLVFYGGQEKAFDPTNPQRLLMPYMESQIFLLPAYVDPRGNDSEWLYASRKNGNDASFPNIIEITKGGGRTYAVKENTNYLPLALDYGQLVFRLIRRYGFSDVQAAKFMKSLDTEISKKFSVKEFLNESGAIAKPTGQVEDKLRKTASVTLSICENLSKVKDSFTFEDVKAAKELDLKMEFLLHKAAADAPANPIPRPSYRDTILKSQSNSKDAQEIIDLLTYYALGKIRNEDLVGTLTKLDEGLKEVENLLCKVLILAQLGKVPAIDYADIKILLSYIDTQISMITSSRVLAKGLG